MKYELSLQTVLKSSILTTVCITHIIPQNTVAKAAVAYKEDRRNEYQTADGAWFALQEKADHVQQHEHDMCVQESRIQRLRNEKNWYKPLEAIHFVWLGSGWAFSRRRLPLLHALTSDHLLSEKNETQSSIIASTIYHMVANEKVKSSHIETTE